MTMQKETSEMLENKQVVDMIEQYSELSLHKIDLEEGGILFYCQDSRVQCELAEVKEYGDSYEYFLLKLMSNAEEVIEERKAYNCISAVIIILEHFWQSFSQLAY